MEKKVVSNLIFKKAEHRRAMASPSANAIATTSCDVTTRHAMKVKNIVPLMTPAWNMAHNQSMS